MRLLCGFLHLFRCFDADQVQGVLHRRHRCQHQSEALIGQLRVLRIVDFAGAVEGMEQTGQILHVIADLARHAGLGRIRDHVRQLVDVLHQLHLLGVGQQAEGIDRLIGRALADDRAHARVSVLHVVDRVVLRLLAGQFQIEVHVGLDVSGDEEPAGGVNADVVAQFAQRDGVAGALGHLDFLAVLDQTDHLDQIDFQRALRIAHGFQSRRHAGDIAVVVGAPEVDQLGVAALQLVDVVGDIRRHVGQRAVALDQHAVLVVTVFGGLEPESVVLLEGQVHGLHAVKHIVDALGVVLIEEALVDPGIEFAAVHLQVALDLGELAVNALVLEVRHALFRIRIQPLVAVFLSDLVGDVDDILRVVAVFRQRVVISSKVLEVAGDQRFSQHVDLVAGVIDVEFAQADIAGRLQQTCDGISPGGAAGVSAVQVAGRVGGNIFNQDVQAVAGLVLAVVVSRLQNVRDVGGQLRTLDAEVDEARLGDGYVGNFRYGSLQLLCQRLRDGGRGLMQDLGQAHRDVRGIIAHFRIPRDLDHQKTFLRLNAEYFLYSASGCCFQFLFNFDHDSLLTARFTTIIRDLHSFATVKRKASLHRMP